jgi:hypothetical protein
MLSEEKFCDTIYAYDTLGHIIQYKIDNSIRIQQNNLLTNKYHPILEFTC